MPDAKERLITELREYANPAFAAHHAKFFQAYKGGYGEGDRFLGLKVPQIRTVASKYHKALSLEETETLLQSECHELRFAALVILNAKQKHATAGQIKEIVSVFERNIRYINNWDLIDIFTPHILGAHYFGKPTRKIWQFARSKNLWKERISVLTTLYFIRQGEFTVTLELAEHFLNHEHDLMHKAVGWMLREIGKRDKKPLIDFLDKHARIMPRTMLRYSIEKLSPDERKHYMQK